MRSYRWAALALCLAACSQQQLGQMSGRMAPPTVPLDCGDKITRGEDCQAEIPAGDPSRTVQPFLGVRQNTPIARSLR